ncbi:nucleophile aminohydrolase [Rhodotorula diobovata]|uniref:Nucleophile aminohydrolase n=1 Tax=Rhodotorula diobovata TaxID=5288 RepID=A0A5C5FZH9_9BASI|nr:nucleophile aminohydrolase [Rhodotorula diobovata]
MCRCHNSPVNPAPRDSTRLTPCSSCRLLVVKAEEPIQLAQLLTKPAHSIINQASDSRLRLDAGSINADGFGVGWYPTDTDPGTPGPCVFRSITPAWSNLNLHRLADKIKSGLVFAHVRASTTGALSEENTGCISDFHRIKRRLQGDLSDEFFAVPQGNTDSEWAFACFLEQLSKLVDPKTATIPHATLRQAMLDTVQLLTRYTKDVGADPSLMNFCVSDGTSVVATRYITSASEEAASLFFSTGSTFEEYEPGASEPLTFERADWVEIPSQSCIVITPRNNLLRYPIINEYFQPTATSHRADGYARAKGFRWAKGPPVGSGAAAVEAHNPFPFPRGKDPSPFDIFHFRRDQALSAKDVKARYLQLVKIYHPDRRAAAASSSSSSRKGKGKAAPDADHEFKSIVAAYELLSSPSRRDTYLRTGLGWGSTASYRGGAGSPWSQSTAEYHFRRGRPMTHGRRAAGTYDHWAWSQTWSDPHSPHFRPEDAARGGAGMSSPSGGAGAGTGWEGQGLFARNGVVFLVLAGLTLTVTPLTAWSVVPTVPKGADPFAPGSDGLRMSQLPPGGPEGTGSAWMPRVYDKRHQDAALNLQRARLEARERGPEKRDAIKRRVEEIRRVQAFDRAREVQAVEQGRSGTGHQLATLPAPAPAGAGAGTD